MHAEITTIRNAAAALALMLGRRFISMLVVFVYWRWICGIVEGSDHPETCNEFGTVVCAAFAVARGGSDVARLIRESAAPPHTEPALLRTLGRHRRD